jgi:hypothetical protein
VLLPADVVATAPQIDGRPRELWLVLHLALWRGATKAPIALALTKKSWRRTSTSYSAVSVLRT